jgi:peptidoglycan/LPS O-acetylase OafA/YrhL
VSHLLQIERSERKPIRNLGLDLLRLLAVLLVIGRHIAVPEGSNEFLIRWVRGGWIGVDLFFVLSGFLISSLLFREYSRKGTLDIKRFLIRRGFKIYPAFFLFLIATVIIKYSIGEGLGRAQILAEVLFIQSYFVGVWDHTWSLAVEEHFYLGLSALVVYLIARVPNHPFSRMPAIFAAIAVACFSFRMLTLWLYPVFSNRTCLFPSHLRMDSLMFGVLVSYLWNFRDLEKWSSRIPSIVLWIAGSLMLSPAFFYEVTEYRWVSIFGVAMFYAGSGVLLLAALRIADSTSWIMRGLASLGAASYSIYLWHLPVLTWGHDLEPIRKPLHV